MPIAILPDYLISQIAAGEVVERPASVIKELIENALDAGSSQIDIRLEEGGMRRIAIKDNGCGIPAQQIPLALQRHATSKIVQLVDLENIATMGFRGEALAAIASVARLTITSKTAQCEHATTLVHETGEIKPAAGEVGTTLEIHDLYFNTPARRKFLKTVNTEFAHCFEVVKRIALAHPDIAFRLWHQDKAIAHYPIQNLSERIEAVLGDSFAEQSLMVDVSADEMRLVGLLGLPTIAKGRGDQQYFYVNGRFVKDKVLTHAARMAYQDVLHGQFYPAYVLNLIMPPQWVDVNVHPAKTEVRFRHSQQIHQWVMHAIERTLASPHLAAQQQGSLQDLKPHQGLENSSLDSSTYQFLGNKSSTWVKQQPNAYVVATPKLGLPTKTSTSQQRYFDWLTTTQVPQASPNSVGNEIAEQRHTYQATFEQHQDQEGKAIPTLGYAIAQLHDIYILAQNAAGLIIVDMHAAHERVIYEQLKIQMNANQIEVQPMLIPLSFHASPIEVATFENYQSQLQTLGFDMSLAGQASLIVRSLPRVLEVNDPLRLVRDVLHELEQHGKTLLIENSRNAVLARLACHAAIKAHEKLSLEEMNAILRQMEQSDRADQCNHGRPTWMQVDLITLDSWFLRGQ